MRIRIAKSQLITLLTARFTGAVLFFSTIYLCFVLLLPNASLFLTTLQNSMGPPEKILFFYHLLIGTFFSNPITENTLILATAMLVGLNLSLALQKFSAISARSTHMLIGGETLFGALASGCASCGTPLLSTLAVGAGLAIAPLHLLAIQIGILLLLFFSFFSTLQKIGYCTIKR